MSDDPRATEPLCRCGHDRLEHWDGRLQCFDGLLSHCAKFTPAPPPVPVSDEAEADMTEAEEAWLRWIFENADLFNTDRLSFLAGFRAARQAGIAAHMADKKPGWDCVGEGCVRTAEDEPLYRTRPKGQPGEFMCAPCAEKRRLEEEHIKAHPWGAR